MKSLNDKLNLLKRKLEGGEIITIAILAWVVLDATCWTI